MAEKKPIKFEREEGAPATSEHSSIQNVSTEGGATEYTGARRMAIPKTKRLTRGRSDLAPVHQPSEEGAPETSGHSSIQNVITAREATEFKGARGGAIAKTKRATRGRSDLAPVHQPSEEGAPTTSGLSSEQNVSTGREATEFKGARGGAIPKTKRSTRGRSDLAGQSAVPASLVSSINITGAVRTSQQAGRGRASTCLVSSIFIPGSVRTSQQADLALMPIAQATPRSYTSIYFGNRVYPDGHVPAAVPRRDWRNVFRDMAGSCPLPSLDSCLCSLCVHNIEDPTYLIKVILFVIFCLMFIFTIIYVLMHLNDFSSNSNNVINHT